VVFIWLIDRFISSSLLASGDSEHVRYLSLIHIISGDYFEVPLLSPSPLIPVSCLMSYSHWRLFLFCVCADADGKPVGSTTDHGLGAGGRHIVADVTGNDVIGAHSSPPYAASTHPAQHLQLPRGARGRLSFRRQSVRQLLRLRTSDERDTRLPCLLSATSQRRQLLRRPAVLGNPAPPDDKQ